METDEAQALHARKTGKREPASEGYLGDVR